MQRVWLDRWRQALRFVLEAISAASYPLTSSPTDVLEQAKARKAQGFTAVKMNAVESVRESLERFTAAFSDLFLSQLAWLDSPHALDATVKRLEEVKSIGIDVGL